MEQKHRTLAYARAQAQAARRRLQAAPLNSGRHADAKSSLEFWESRAAVIAAGGFGNVKTADEYIRRDVRAAAVELAIERAACPQCKALHFACEHYE